MLARFVKPTGLKAAGLALNARLLAQQSRSLANVSAAAPSKRVRSPPVTHDRATFTIRVSRVEWRCATGRG